MFLCFLCFKKREGRRVQWGKREWEGTRNGDGSITGGVGEELVDLFVYFICVEVIFVVCNHEGNHDVKTFQRSVNSLQGKKRCE